MLCTTNLFYGIYVIHHNKSTVHFYSQWHIHQGDVCFTINTNHKFLLNPAGCLVLSSFYSRDWWSSRQLLEHLTSCSLLITPQNGYCAQEYGISRFATSRTNYKMRQKYFTWCQHEEWNVLIFRESKHLFISGNHTLRTYLQNISNSAALRQFMHGKEAK